jgi:hypothetical protein
MTGIFNCQSSNHRAALLQGHSPRGNQKGRVDVKTHRFEGDLVEPALDYTHRRHDLPPK